ncbi:MAG: beta-Ala-His dipeptidase [Bacteriovoracaceae bacterium]|nr:beta-Ala-His dipeptidase [Bacteriovoracaceae bacterium]
MNFTKEITEKFPKSPFHLWNHFFQLAQFPRPSTHEEKVSEYIEKYAKSKGHQVERDEVGNVLVRMAAKGKFKKLGENLVVAIQNHTDMVTDARPSKQIDFQKDPITCFVDHDWLRAHDTTLGADNGIGCAAALALMDLDENVDLPSLELLFTIDEERGLNGAKGLKSGWLKSKILLNLDTEEWGTATVGCTGGLDLEFDSKLKLTKIPVGYQYYQISISHLCGGHSGIDIHLQRSNSIQLLSQLILELPESSFLTEFKAGKAHNIIPRDATCVIAVKSDSEKRAIEQQLEKWTSTWRKHINKEDQNFELKWEVAASKVESGLAASEWMHIFSALNLFPHGPLSFIKDGGEKLKDLVQASCNLAKLIIKGDQLYIQSSLRSFRNYERDLLVAKLNSFARVLNLNVREGVGYPGWTPEFESEIIKYTKNIFHENFGGEIEIIAIHAGLECGLLLDKYPELKAISVGPTIRGAHSPDERVHIPSVTDFWKLLLSMLKDIDQVKLN